MATVYRTVLKAWPAAHQVSHHRRLPRCECLRDAMRAAQSLPSLATLEDLWVKTPPTTATALRARETGRRQSIVAESQQLLEFSTHPREDRGDVTVRSCNDFRTDTFR